MKKTLLLTLLVAMATGVFAQTQRTVLLEHFTQASCGPCASQNPLVKQYFDNIDNTTVKATAIKYQTSWPGTDPMNTHNPTDVASRVSYYGVTGVPNAFIDGYVNTDPSQPNYHLPGNLFDGGNSPDMDARAAIMSDFDITVTLTLSSDLSSVTAFGLVTASNIVANPNLVAHVAIVEKEIIFSSAPGSNGETEFYNVMKKMLPSATGTPLQATWQNGTSYTTTEVWNISNVYSIGELAAIVFIQDNNTKEILQAGISGDLIVPSSIQTADLVATSSFAGSADLCDNAYTPSVTVTNNSSENLNSVEVTYTVNNVPSGTQTIALNANANQTINFPAASVLYGDNVTYSVDIQDAGFHDLFSNNNTVEINNFLVLDPTFDNGSDLDVQFNNLALGAPSPAGAIDDNPNNIRAFYVDNGISTGVTWNLGGNGNSNGCFRWDYYGIAPGASSSLIFEEIDFTGTYNSMLSFTYAYAQFNNEDDQLVISASNDCGNTWVELFNEKGSELTTVGAAVSTGRFYPQANEWEDVTVPMTMFNGQSNVILKVEGISAYGNCLYIDDIKTSSFLVSTEDEKLETSLNVYPNPAVNDFNVSFEINEASDMNITLVNGIGQTIRTISNETFAAGEHLINVNTADLAAGTYFVTIRSEEGTTTKTITVAK
ncbi:MAG: T9SS type A sorting domain-containing protein [Saprospiraceae bacterium]